ncbi:phospholipase-like protein [Tanacetum coccineum]
MDMRGYEVPHVLVTCRSRQIDDENDDDENVLLNYYINNDLSIQFGREKFCLVTGLRFEVENKEEYDPQANLPFRRRVFPLHLDGQHITGIDIANAIVGPTFAELYNDDVVGLCCLGILLLVLLGAESRRNVPEWLLRITNDRVAWNKYLWGSYVWPTLVAAWRKKTGRFTAEMGNIPVARLTPDDIEARPNWWISSIYRQFVEQKIKLERNKKVVDDIKEEMKRLREEMNARPVRQENTVPIIVGQHYGLSDFSEFTSMQMPEQSASHYWQPSSHPGSYYSFGQVPSHMGRPNLQTTIDTQHDVDGIVDQNISNRGKRQQLPRCREEIMKTPDMQSLSYDTLNGWLGGEHMNSWMEVLIRRRHLNANWTVAYTSTISVHPKNNQFIILNDPHVIGILDGSTRPYPSWNDVDWVFLPIHVAGNHWVTGVIDLANSHFYVFDSLASEENKKLCDKLRKW